MIKTIELILPPQQAADKESVINNCAEILSVTSEHITSTSIVKRSIDARSRQIKVRLMVEVYIDEKPPTKIDYNNYFLFQRDVSKSKPVIIVGCGPAGMFAALRLIELGLKPVIIERGKDIRSRRRDLAAINKLGIVNPDSNYCFGEGGAGTYSDGKLYTRSTKRGDVQRILKIFIAHGADENILIDAHPHIGTNKLPAVVQNIRQTILNAGGEIHFSTRLKDFIIEDKQLRGIVAEEITKEKAEGAIREIFSDYVILATGHSARDIFFLLRRENILIEAKPFAIGVRMEHPQQIINAAQYHTSSMNKYLPPASYSVSCQVDNRGVYSFCMCPGGIIAPSATDKSEIVVNGWSPSKRNNPFANSGLVVSVDEKDFSPFKKHGELAALHYQMHVESAAFQSAGNDGVNSSKPPVKPTDTALKAPAQRMIDFMQGKQSPDLPPCSYIPGVTSIQLKDVLPQEVTSALRRSLEIFGKKMKALYTNEALLLATESRTSSPVRIPRDKESLQHPQVKGLYPCGEGAGYAGGIVSAAIDGERCADAVGKEL